MAENETQHFWSHPVEIPELVKHLKKGKVLQPEQEPRQEQGEFS